MPREPLNREEAPKVGFFGKVPTHGDFVSRRLSRAHRSAFDGWLSQSVAASQRQLGERWTKLYLLAPIWRFVVSTHMLGPHPVAGVMMPSVDRVGRYFPLLLCVELPNCQAASRLFRVAGSWFEDAEELALSSLDQHFKLEQFDAEVAAFAPPALDRKASNFLARHGGPADSEGLELAHKSDDALSMWWTLGSDTIGSAVLSHPGFPPPERFAALLDGHWQQWGWPQTAQQPTPAGQAPNAPPPQQAQHCSAARTHPGTVRPRNEDAFIEQPELGLWAVADGAGGHAAGAFASAAVIEKLATLMTPLSFGGALAEIGELLDEANDVLRAHARKLGSDEMVAAVVVVLFVQGDRFAVIWAGDSRAYVLRGGILAKLTADHRGDGGSNTVRCAIGAEDVLVSDIAYGRVEEGDRFVLCSDGLTGCLTDEQLASAASQGDPMQAAARLIDDALVGGARDNVTVVIVDLEGRAP